MHDDDSVNIVLELLLQKCVELGEPGHAKTDLGGVATAHPSSKGWPAHEAGAIFHMSLYVKGSLTLCGLVEIEKANLTWMGEGQRDGRHCGLNYGSPFVAVKGLNPRSARAAHEAAPRCGNRK
jgi:hypothetical protein